MKIFPHNNSSKGYFSRKIAQKGEAGYRFSKNIHAQRVFWLQPEARQTYIEYAFQRQLHKCLLWGLCCWHHWNGFRRFEFSQLLKLIASKTSKNVTQNFSLRYLILSWKIAILTAFYMHGRHYHWMGVKTEHHVVQSFSRWFKTGCHVVHTNFRCDAFESDTLHLNRYLEGGKKNCKCHGLLGREANEPKDRLTRYKFNSPPENVHHLEFMSPQK